MLENMNESLQQKTSSSINLLEQKGNHERLVSFLIKRLQEKIEILGGIEENIKESLMEIENLVDLYEKQMLLREPNVCSVDLLLVREDFLKDMEIKKKVKKEILMQLEMMNNILNTYKTFMLLEKQAKEMQKTFLILKSIIITLCVLLGIAYLD
ncbi:MAG: hypothetical protein KAI16_03205 [Candidatus Pacebacteria bacterium]|nr:hypothetical protein [Candidatus Paceibacterota bacterium]